MSTPAQRVIRAAGSPSVLADTLGCSRATVTLWSKRGGLIPAQWQRIILEKSNELGWGLTPADLVDHAVE